MKEKRRLIQKNIEEKGNGIVAEDVEGVTVFLWHGLTRGGLGAIQ